MKNSTARNVQSAPQICRLDKLVIVSNDATAALNITMVYEDDQTREWAREAFERVNKLAGKQPVRPTWWKLSKLSDPGVLAASVSTAMRADVIVVAVRASEGMPLPFYAWTNSWSPNRHQINGVLVALLGSPEPRNKRSGRVAAYLQTIARQARLDFLVEQRAVSTAVSAPVSGNGHQHASTDFAERF
jgi:hypothetical protein